MSKLQELIQALCPNGVEYKPIWQLTAWDKRFNTVDKHKQQKIITYPYLLAKDMLALECKDGNVRLLSTGEYIGYTTEEKAGPFLCIGEIVSIPWGGTMKGLKYFNGKFVTADNRICTSLDTTILNNKYLYYIFENNREVFDKFYRGAGIKHPNMNEVLNFEIPVPPIEVQEEIVRILDAFTEMTASLQAELQAELQARKEQYEYYRNLLLSFNTTYGDADDEQKDKLTIAPPSSCRIKWLSMGEICDIRNGYTPSKANPDFWEEGTIPWFRMEDIRQNGRILSDSIQHITPQAVKGGKYFPANSIILATTATIGEHALIIADSLANQQFTNLSIRKSLIDKIDIKYFFHYLFIVDEWCKKNTNVSGFASVDMTKFKKLLIPIPPLDVQEKIVRILDKFEAIVSDLSAGIPAEIAARQEQYEYYRNRLLTFPQL